MKKEKGYALITSVVIVSLLFILASSVLALSVSAFKASKRIEETNKVKLAAESGIEKGKLLLKNYLLVNTNHTTNLGLAAFDYLNFNPSEMNDVFAADRDYQDANNIHVKIHFGPASGTETFFDSSTGRNIKYITIDVIADKGNATKSYSVVLDKYSLTNVYFNQIFNNTMTTADTINSAAGDGATASLNVESGVKLNITGNLFFQGTNLQLYKDSSTYDFKLSQGKITANTNKLFTNVKNLKDLAAKTETNIDLFKNSQKPLNDGWVEAVPRYLKVLNILSNTGENPNPNADPILDLASHTTPTDEDFNKYVKFQIPLDPLDVNAKPISAKPTLITFKVENNKNHVNFQNIIAGADKLNPLVNPDVYKTIVNRLLKDNPSYTMDNAVADYKNIYKLILVDGDLDIDSDSEEQFINYLIYCTGTVTFNGQAHFYNSSIFSKRINVKYEGPESEGVEFYGVGTDKALAYTNGKTLSDFSDTDKMVINEYLIKNLDSYADNIEYKVVQYK